MCYGCVMGVLRVLWVCYGCVRGVLVECYVLGVLGS